MCYEADESANLQRVEAVLNNKEHLRKGRIHPIDVLKALKTYESGGRLGRSQENLETSSSHCGHFRKSG